jgi:histidine triad (HIT) family protein
MRKNLYKVPKLSTRVKNGSSGRSGCPCLFPERFFSYFGVLPSTVSGFVDHQDDTCIFCDILARRSPAEVLYENAHALAILDIRPIHHGHSLVIPKVHCRDFLDVPPDYLPGLMEATQTVAAATVRTLSLQGFNVFSNNGRVAGQSVFHFHFHVTPRYHDDQIRFELTLKRYTDGQMQDLGRRIRQNLPALSR